MIFKEKYNFYILLLFTTDVFREFLHLNFKTFWNNKGTSLQSLF